MTEDEAEDLMDIIAKAAKLNEQPHELTFTRSDFDQVYQDYWDDKWYLKYLLKNLDLPCMEK